MSTTLEPAPLPTGLAELLDSTDALTDADELQRRADRDGYLFFRQLLPADAVRQVRDELHHVLEVDGVLVPDGHGRVDHARLDPIPAEELRIDIGVPTTSYVHIQQVASMHRLPHHPSLMSLYRRLIGPEVFVHPRHIVRAMTGHPALSPTPPHQDFPLVQGTTRTWTAWFPLDDCPRERGPLAVLRGSHRGGYLPIAAASGAGAIQALLCQESDWASADFAIGDVLTFTSLTVHRSVPATTRETIRLSMDVRYQDAADPIEAKSLSNHSDVAWDEIYRGWPDDDIQYYWRTGSPTLSPWDDTLLQPGRRIC